MALQEKYKALTDAAALAGVTDLAVREADGILYVDGTATSGAVKQQLWDMYETIDPNFSSGDLVLNINASNVVTEGSKIKITTSKSNLNVRKGPGTDQDIIGKAGHGEVVTLIRKENDQWWYIKTESGVEGYSFTQYLTPVE
ncbi:MAG: SH3 domain-containing protein [Bacteroidota bacterium]